MYKEQNLLVSASYDGTSRFWSLPTGNPLLRLNERSSGFSTDGHWTSTRVGRWRVVVPEEHRALFQQRALGAAHRSTNKFSVHPNGRLLVVGNYAQLMFWDLATLQLVAGVKIPGGLIRINAEGTEIFTLSENGRVSVHRVRRRETDAEIHFEIGPGQLLTPTNVAREQTARDDLNYIQMGVQRARSQVRILNTKTHKLRQFKVNHSSIWDCDITRDGSLIATGTFHGRNVRVYDGPTGNLVQTIPSGNAKVRFSPDGKILAVSEPGRCSFYHARTGNLLHQSAPQAKGDLPGPVVFSHDGSMVAFCGEQRYSLRVLRVTSFEELATFEVSDEQMIYNIYFSPDGSQLIVSPNYDTIIHIFDLRKVRANLRELDWDGPTLPNPTFDAAKPLRIELQLENR